MVCGFTLITVVNLVLLQTNPSWAVTASDVVQGMSFRLPPHSETALATALFTFGIIGVGASEIVAYPYWCIEKGYARFAGPRDRSPEWAARAQGWMRVMRWDAWLSMVIYTFATIAFYLLGAAILGRTGLNPEKSEMIRTLAVMYEPVFTEWASVLFLVGAFAVLYSTYFVANAAHARVFSDTLGVLGAASKSQVAHHKRVVFLSGLFPLLCLVMYVFFPRPAQLVLISGLMQAVMLPMLAVAGVYFRYFRNDPRLVPGRTWDVFLWVSAVGMSIAGIWALISTFQ
jgi:Mn2+/Fe2+ NRAMP family transporter